VTNGFNDSTQDHELTSGLRDALAGRFDRVDWDGLHDRIMADALSRSGPQQRPADVLASWSVRGSAAAGVLLAAGIAALLLMSDSADADPVPPGFWPVAEELIAAVPADTRQLLQAASDAERLLQIMSGGEEIIAR
jgi:hypothetical protein